MKILTFILLHIEESADTLMLKNIPSDLPFHPLFVHAPIILTFLIPIIALLLMIKFRNNQEFNYWNFILILNIFLVVSTYFALFTGDIEYELLQHSPYLKQAIEQHEKFAESFFVLSIFILAISFLGHTKFSFYKIMRILTLVVYFFIAIPIVIYTAHLGGKIVYELDAPYFRKVIIKEYQEQQKQKKEVK
jgi:uncharacterized membrane protein